MAPRILRTRYWFRKQLVKTTYSANQLRVVPNAIMHMQTNEYGATVCQIDDIETGQLHAEIKRSIPGDIKITFKRDPRDFVTASTLKHFMRRMKRRAR